MKSKALVLVVILALAVSGCAGFGKWSSGAQNVVDMICAPTADQQQTATIMLAALDVGWSFVPVVGAVKASAVLKVIQAGGCFLASELADAFKVVDAANTATASVQLKKLKMAPAPLPEYAPLRKLIK
jgi:hypothetical protein